MYSKFLLQQDIQIAHYRKKNVFSHRSNPVNKKHATSVQEVSPLNTDLDSFENSMSTDIFNPFPPTVVNKDPFSEKPLMA